MKINLLVITNMYPSQKTPSFGIFVKNQVTAIRNKGIHVDVVGINDHRMGKFYIIKKYLMWIMKIFLYLFKGRKYHIIHCHYVFPSGFFGLIFQKLFGTRLVVTAHGGDIDKMARKNKFLFKQTKKILEKADEIIAVGEKLKHDIVNDFGIPKERISIINMGVNRNVFKPIHKDAAKNQLNLSRDFMHILYVGNLIKAKGLEELVGAFKNLKKDFPNIQLHLIGANKEPSFLKSLKEKITNEKIDNIYFYPPMKQSEIAVWMSAADVFVLPSHMEGFGLVALEAMSCHTPVVGSDVGGLSYLLSNNAGVLVQPENTESLKNGIEKVLKDADFRRKLILQGEKRADENDEKKQISLLLNVYKKLILSKDVKKDLM